MPSKYKTLANTKFEYINNKVYKDIARSYRNKFGEYSGWANMIHFPFTVSTMRSAKIDTQILEGKVSTFEKFENAKYIRIRHRVLKRDLVN